jgi:hypothetical protein
LAIGRIIDYISHSNVWSTSAIFLEEDDAQNGVDHVDGHRSPGYVVSPYVVQNGPVVDTYYSQVNFTRTIEQILGLPPMNEYDLVASPLRPVFTDNPPPENFAPWTHVLNAIPLCTSGAPIYGPSNTVPCPLPAAAFTPKTKDSAKVAALRKAWMQKRAQIFAGKLNKPDAEDPDTVNHLNWYEATGFVRPYPGESKVRPPSDFNNPAPTTTDDD